MILTPSVKRGMTLIEVIMAAFILGTGLLILVTASSRCTAVMKKAAIFQSARWALDRGEADHPLVRTNDVKSLAVSPVEYSGGFTYERIIGDDEGEDGLFVVTSRVSWVKDGRYYSEEIVRYVLQDEKDRNRLAR